MIRTRRTDGFTLMELLLTVTIMGVLAAVVVFGAGDFGTATGCKADAKALRNAESSFYVTNGRYATQTELVDAGLLRSVSILHDVEVSGLSYTVEELGKCVNSGTADASVLPSTTVTKKAGFTTLVVSPNGAPVSGAAVSYSTGNGKFTDLGTTGASGTVTASIAAGTYDIRVSMFGANNDLSGVAVVSRTLVVLPTVAMTVRFVDSTGADLDGGVVAIRQTGTSTFFDVGTTAAGTALVVQVLPSDYDAQMTWRNTSNVRSALSINTASVVQFVTTKLSVVVTDAAGSPVKGASVSVVPSGTSAAAAVAATDVDGRAVQEKLPGSYDASTSYLAAGAADPTVIAVSAVPVGAQAVVVELVVA